MYEVILYKDAVKFLKKIGKTKAEKVKKDLENLKNWPKVKNIKKMYGEYDGYYRKRVGDIRIIFFVKNSQRKIYIDSINFRGSVY